MWSEQKDRHTDWSEQRSTQTNCVKIERHTEKGTSHIDLTLKHWPRETTHLVLGEGDGARRVSLGGVVQEDDHGVRVVEVLHHGGDGVQHGRAVGPQLGAVLQLIQTLALEVLEVALDARVLLEVPTTGKYGYCLKYLQTVHMGTA